MKMIRSKAAPLAALSLDVRKLRQHILRRDSLRRLVVQETFLDHVAAVTEAEDKISETIMRVQLHNMP